MDFENKPASPFFTKRNLIALFVWCTLCVFLVVGITVNAVMFSADKITSGDVNRRLFYALLCFVMMSAVFIVEFIFRLHFPLALEIMCMLLAFAALAGGTVFNIYGRFSQWDKVLHTLSGPIFSFAGLCLADIILKNQPQGERKVVASVLVALLVALSVGYLWEIFEYTIDSVIPGYNNQRWISGVVEELENGTYIVTDRRGAALHDTMWDMICNFLGAVAFLFPLLIALLKHPEQLRLFRVEKRIKRKQQLLKKSDIKPETPPEPQQQTTKEEEYHLQTNQTQDL